MDASLQSRAQQLANEFAGQATTVEELNELIRLMMKSGLERMPNKTRPQSRVTFAASATSGDSHLAPRKRNIVQYAGLELQVLQPRLYDIADAD